MSEQLQTDLLVIGGGINGTSIALDAAGRGLNVILCEADDLASGTSSWSSKLIHGGLRYLEQYDFKLVRHALQEREVWLKRAPHLIKPLQFILPHEKHLRPRWMLRIGLWLYDHLAKRKTIPGSRAITNIHSPYIAPLAKTNYAFSYYDCFCDDARLVIETAKSAKNLGVKIFTRTPVIQLQADSKHWLCQLGGQHAQTIEAKCVINAAGPWTDIVSQQAIDPSKHYDLQLVKGSHIVVDKLYDGDHAYILQNADQRIVFAIPFQKNHTLIGTTDISYQGDPRDAKIDEQETTYLIDIINRYFKKNITKQSIHWRYSGVRPLFAEDSSNPSKMSRDYKIITREDPAPLVTILGGKLTTARVLAEEAVNTLKGFFPSMTAPWTASTPLSGGSPVSSTYRQQFPFLSDSDYQALFTRYGSNLATVFANITHKDQLGSKDIHGFYACEISYCRDHEWAQTDDDLLWRRSKLGLTKTARTQQNDTPTTR